MIKIEKLNETHLRVFSDDGIERELHTYFEFVVPGSKYSPKYKAKLWDGKIRLYNIGTKTLYVGLLNALKEFAELNGYDLELGRGVECNTAITPQEVKTFVDSLNLHGRGEKIELRDYQLDAIHHAIHNERVFLKSPTASGKSAIIYSIMRHHLEHNRKCLLIVPTLGLLSQMEFDFKDYSSHDPNWNAQDNIGIISGGYSKNPQISIIKFVMEDNSVRRYKPHDIVETKSGKKFAKDVVEDDDLV